MSEKPRPKSASNLEDSDTEPLDNEISLNPKFIRTAKFKSTTDLTKENSPDLNVERSTSESNVLITQNPLKTVGKPKSKTRGRDPRTGRFISIPTDGQPSPSTSQEGTDKFFQLFNETFSKKSPVGLITIDQSRASDSDSEEDSNDNQTLSRQLPFHSSTPPSPHQRKKVRNPMLVVNNLLNPQGAAAEQQQQQQQHNSKEEQATKSTSRRTWQLKPASRQTWQQQHPQGGRTWQQHNHKQAGLASKSTSRRINPNPNPAANQNQDSDSDQDCCEMADTSVVPKQFPRLSK